MPRQRTSVRRLTLALLGVALLGLALGVLHFRGKEVAQARTPGTVAADGDTPTPAPDSGATTKVPGQLMTLDPTRRFLINSFTTKPVFITGEDAWSLEVQLSDDDIRSYLADRATRGFNAIWVGLADNTYSNHPPLDFYGNRPFNGPDFTNENPAYWSRVDRTLSWAAEKGITVFASPAFVGYGCKGGYCESYHRSSTDVLSQYGRFLGSRYKKFSNIVWLIGGDADPNDADLRAKLAALAKGIRSADPSHLMTTESYRGTSSDDAWGRARWMDLDALYVKPEDIPAKANADYRRDIHPLLMFEDWYEGGNSLTEREVREEGYSAVLNGCILGRFFGNYAIWDFSWSGATNDPWHSQLNSEGSIGQAWLGKLFRSREHWKLVPDIEHRVVTAGYDSRPFLSATKESLRSLLRNQPYRLDISSAVAARTSDGQSIIAYVPRGNAATITIAMGSIIDAGSWAKGWWFNPRDGSSKLIGVFAKQGSRQFTPPDANDWVLVIDSQSANLPAPGTIT
ncbi:MAG TPA: DUF4038 domain-containing protein [Silvibacterium sp.]|nr:DUF4038 domain-containing protein [Silvibacterium sp.]